MLEPTSLGSIILDGKYEKIVRNNKDLIFHYIKKFLPTLYFESNILNSIQIICNFLNRFFRKDLRICIGKRSKRLLDASFEYLWPELHCRSPGMSWLYARTAIRVDFMADVFYQILYLEKSNGSHFSTQRPFSAIKKAKNSLRLMR